MSKFAFIQCGEQGKVIEDDDWLVRAHCMLGKNTKKHDTKRRAKRKDTASALRASKVSAGCSPIATSPHQLGSKISASVREDLSAYVAGPVDRESWFYLWRFSCFLPDMYPLDSYMDEVPFLEEVPPSDGSALTTALLTASAHNDYVSHLGLSNRTRHLTVYTCSYLNNVLSKNDPRSRYSAIFGIFHLAAAAVFCQQHDTAYTHLNGMFEVLRSFDTEAETQDSESVHSIASIKFKAERLAFCLFNITGRKGPFLTEPSSVDPQSNSSPSLRPPITTNPKLDTIFHDFRDFCRLVRGKTADGLKVNAKYFRRTINSLQTRVMALPQGLGTPFEECLRLCITAALSTQTQLPMRRLEHDLLNRQLYRYVPLLTCPEDDTEGRNFIFWMVMFAFLIAFDEEGEVWAETLFRRAAGETETWEEAKVRLGEIIWFPNFIEEQGKRTFMRLRERWPREEDGEILLKATQGMD